MKTINNNVQIFNSELSAKRYFNKQKNNCQLLYAQMTKSYYVDHSKTLIKEWPNHYKLIQEK